MLVGNTVKLTWRHKAVTTDVLTNADSTSVVIKDPTGRIRVSYDSNKLSNNSTGEYNYYFDIPTDVVDGEWIIEITQITGVYTALRRIGFMVES